MPATPSPDFSLLRATLGASAARFDVEHLAACESTNTLLLARAAAGAPSGTVILCDNQQAGRGRRGRRWLATPGMSLTFSLLWRFTPPRVPAALSLAVGVAIAEAIESVLPCRIELKWPNDIWLDGRKLGGVLIEATGPANASALVIGIGLNLARDPAWAGDIDQPFTALDAAGPCPPREVVLGRLLEQLASALDRFSTAGFAPFAPAWQARNALTGRSVELISDHGSLSGICSGISAGGELEITRDSQIHLVSAGDVSLRQQFPRG